MPKNPSLTCGHTDTQTKVSLTGTFTVWLLLYDTCPQGRVQLQSYYITQLKRGSKNAKYSSQTLLRVLACIVNSRRSIKEVSVPPILQSKLLTTLQTWTCGRVLSFFFFGLCVFSLAACDLDSLTGYKHADERFRYYRKLFSVLTFLTVSTLHVVNT